MADYGTTTITARRALEELAREGFIETRPTVGTFVRDLDRIRFRASADTSNMTTIGHADRLLSALSEGQPLLITAEAPVLFNPPKGLSERIGREPVLRRRRTFWAGEQPIATGNDYFTLATDLGERLAATPAEVEAFDVLDAAEIVPALVVGETFIRMPAPDEMRINGWPTGMPVFVDMRTAYMPSGEPAASTTRILPADRSIDVQEWPYPAAEPRIRAVG